MGLNIEMLEVDSQYTEWEQKFINNEIKSTYKYRGNLYRDLLTIKNNQIYIPSPKELNDPNECCFNMQNVYNEIKKMQHSCESIFGLNNILSAKNNPQHHYNKIRELRQDFENETYNIGIFSMCKQNDIECLWSYYGNGHKGFCVEYNIPNLVHSLKRNQSFKFILETKYSNIRYSPTYDDMQILFDYNIALLRNSQCSKSEEWKSEKEIRIVSYVQGYIDIPQNVINAIYIGAECPEKDKRLIMKTLRGRDIKFYQMKFKANSFGMESEPIG